MEVDHVAYIFGSVSRRRQSDDATAAKRRSLDQAPASPQPAAAPAAPRRRSPTRPGGVEARAVCGLCRRQQVEPRVLPCLHSFCTGCLLQLNHEPEDGDPWTADNSSRPRPTGAEDGEGSASGAGSSSSGGGARLLQCPSCGATHALPPGGVQALPLDYLLQHRLATATATASRSSNRDAPPCDLCTSNEQASVRCTECAAFLCSFCAEAHGRQRGTASHTLLPAAACSPRGRRSVAAAPPALPCAAHPGLELRLFCSTCSRPVCRDCAQRGAHRTHAVEPAASAAQACAAGLRDALEHARPAAEQAALALDRLAHLERSIQVRCGEVSEEVDRFIDSYAAALEEHRRALQRQVQEARAAKLQLVQEHARQLRRRADQAAAALAYADDLLADATDVEMLSLVEPVLRRLEWCGAGGGAALLEPRVSDCLQFLPQETCQGPNSHTLFGVITTQTVSPQQCTLNTDTLMNCRQHKKAEAVLTTRDSDDQPLCHGGEKVSAELRYRDASRRKIPIQVTDRRDGTYLLAFVPDTPGNLNLSVTVRGKHVKGSPFLVCVRTLRPHHGSFHCCSFCSSNGSKEATCGCGGKMPGGYQGCGHGHAGHPGRRHWSCCGNVLENSECGRTNSALYQFSL